MVSLLIVTLLHINKPTVVAKLHPTHPTVVKVLQLPTQKPVATLHYTHGALIPLN